MRTLRVTRGIGSVVAACTALTLLSGCGGASAASGAGTFFGPSQPLGNGTVQTYAVLDDAGNPTEVGLRMTPTALDGLPGPADGPPPMLMLDFPDQAARTAFDHVMVNWNPEGHDPVVLFGEPHFDFHFDMVDMAALDAINPADPEFAAKAERAPEAKYVPEGYVVPPGGTAAEQAVPGMGVHLVDSTDTSLVPGSYDFEQILINGTWDGRHIFIEPMITREWLLTGPNLEQPLKLPQAYQRAGYHPTTYGVHVDERSKDYVITLGGMTMRVAS